MDSLMLCLSRGATGNISILICNRTYSMTCGRGIPMAKWHNFSVGPIYILILILNTDIIIATFERCSIFSQATHSVLLMSIFPLPTCQSPWKSMITQVRYFPDQLSCHLNVQARQKVVAPRQSFPQGHVQLQDQCQSLHGCAYGHGDN